LSYTYFILQNGLIEPAGFGIEIFHLREEVLLCLAIKSGIKSKKKKTINLQKNSCHHNTKGKI
jgi:hypothetical protein